MPQRAGETELKFLNRYHKSAVPPVLKNKGRETMVKYSKEFKEQARLLSDGLGVKGSRADGNQLLHDC